MEELLSNFFVEYDVLSSIEDLTFDEYNEQGFDEFVENGYEAKLYVELSLEDKSWYFLRHPVDTIALFREIFKCYGLRKLPSENLNDIFTDWHIFESCAKIEIEFFITKYQEWIAWNKEKNYIPFLTMLELPLEETFRLATSVEKFYHLLDLFKHFLKESDIEVLPRNPNPTIKQSIPNNYNREEIESREEKLKKVYEIIAFLNKTEDGIRKYMTEKSHSKLKDYLNQLVLNGKVNFPENNAQFEITNLAKRDIIYTFNLLNTALYKSKRNPETFRILGYCSNAGDGILEAIRNRTLAKHTAYKDFKERTLDYINHNPNFILE